MSDDSTADDRLRDRQTTGEDRVRMVARQIAEPRTANWIAEEADWSHEPTRRVLERLVADGVLRREDSGPHTTYVPDYRRQAMQEAMRLRDGDHSVETLTDRLEEMNDRIRDWSAEFDVDSPNQLRATLDDDIDVEEADRRREIAREWDHLRRRRRIVRFVVREWDFLSPGQAPVEG